MRPRRGRRAHVRPARPQVSVVRGAAWLSEDIALISFAAGGTAVDPAVDIERREGRLFNLSPAAAARSTASTALCAMYGRRRVLEARSSALIAIDVVDRTLHVETQDVLGSVTDLRTLLRDELSIWDATTRSDLLAFLSTLPTVFGDSSTLTTGLWTAREALRERHAMSMGADSDQPGLGIDMVCRIDRRRFYVQGWIQDRSAPLLNLWALSPQGERVELAERAVRYPRKIATERRRERRDVEDRSGFVCLFETQAPGRGNDWVFTMQDARGEGVQAPGVALVDDPDESCQAVLNAVDWDLDERSILLAKHVEPALTGLQSELRDRVGISVLEQFGTPPDDPEVSIVLSLDADGELLELHLAHIVDDSSLRRCELVCVLDGPRDVENCCWRAEQLYELYGLSLRLVSLTEPGGAAFIRDAGASVASASRLLFLEAGVLASSAGWLPPLVRFHAATPRAGALAPKLLTAGPAIDHAGLTLRRHASRDELEPVGRFAGLHESLPVANATCPVPAVSGACMLVDAGTYSAAAGAGWRYVKGGHADVDLCLQLAQAGHENWYVPRVALSRIGLSPSCEDERRLDDLYNRWLLWQLRGEATEMVGAYGEPEAGATA